MPKYDLVLNRPLLNAAGSLGFAPGIYSPLDLSQQGAFVTNPVSLKARTPARGTRLIHFSGGFLLHTGYPNPGMGVVLKRYSRRWSQAPLPVIVHVLAQTDSEVAQIVRRLELLEGVMAVEVGLPPDIAPGSALRFAQSAEGELPVVVRLPLDRAAELALALAEAEVAAFSLGPPRGALLGEDGTLVHGRLYGPALLPQALAAVRLITPLEVPVFGAGGIYTRADVEAMLAAGASAVQLDAALWGAGWLRHR